MLAVIKSKSVATSALQLLFFVCRAIGNAERNVYAREIRRFWKWVKNKQNFNATDCQ